MRKADWSTDDLNEFDALMEDVLREPVVARRREIFLDGLDRALANHACARYECWAHDALDEIRHDGADRILKREKGSRTPRVVVTHEGEILGKAPRELGRRTRGDSGEIVHERRLFDFMSWDDLRAKKAEFARAEHAAAVDRLMIEKLLRLEQLVPEAASPAAACDRLGTTVDEWLMSDAA